ncbi:hypothetical protein TcCL_NonESM01364, partial [Trypanosoma cruzi]
MHPSAQRHGAVGASAHLSWPAGEVAAGGAAVRPVEFVFGHHASALTGPRALAHKSRLLPSAAARAHHNPPPGNSTLSFSFSLLRFRAGPPPTVCTDRAPDRARCYVGAVAQERKTTTIAGIGGVGGGKRALSRKVIFIVPFSMRRSNCLDLEQHVSIVARVFVCVCVV